MATIFDCVWYRTHYVLPAADPAHSEHIVALAYGMNVPAGQRVQRLMLPLAVGSEAKVPGAHGLHAPPIISEPARHKIVSVSAEVACLSAAAGAFGPSGGEGVWDSPEQITVLGGSRAMVPIWAELKPRTTSWALRTEV